MDAYGLVGKSGTFKIIRRGYPQMKGTIVNADTAICGTVRIKLEENGCHVAALYPAVELTQ